MNSAGEGPEVVAAEREDEVRVALDEIAIPEAPPLPGSEPMVIDTTEAPKQAREAGVDRVHLHRLLTRANLR